MKQKRKAKSSNSSKIGLNIVGKIGLLVVLGGVLCFASIGLQNKSAIAAEGDDVSTMKIEYQGVNDKVEVVYDLSFIKENGVNGMDILSNIYKVGSSLYMTPKNVIVDGHGLGLHSVVDEGVYGHVLGGDRNQIHSDNVTVIAGESVIVSPNNKDATVLGGKENNIGEGEGSRTAILVGGYRNHIYSKKEGTTIIGGNNNDIKDNATDVTILGGNNNKVSGNNAIVGGSKVVVPGSVNNVFAFSDKTDGLTIENGGSDSFYLNVENGLGINVDTTTNGVETGGPVDFGEIDIQNNDCNENNYGVQGTYNGCLMGCIKKATNNNGKWQLLDSNEDCNDLCEDPNNNCEPNPTPTCENNPELCKEGACFGVAIDSNTMEICKDGNGNNLNPKKFWNTAFETTVLSSEEPCPAQGGNLSLVNNQCVYKCKPGYHLLKNDIVDEKVPGLRRDVEGCYKECELPWDHSQKIKHGTSVYGYSNSEVYCAYISDTPKSEDTCKNYKAALKCVNGDLWIVNENTKKLIRKNDVYTKGSCTLGGFMCGSEYNLRETDITNGWKYPEKGVSNWKVGDRDIITGTRGKYKACIDYKSTEGSNGEDCDEVGPDPYHYDLVECMPGYSTGPDFPNECRKMCTVGNQTFKDGETKVGYKSPSVTCNLPIPNPNNSCETVTYTCTDGTWKDSAGNTNPVRDCNTNSTNPCSGYSVPELRYSELINKGYSDQNYYYKACTSNMQTSDRKGCEKNVNYKFEGCPTWDGYSVHEVSLLGGYKLSVCVQDPVCSETHYQCGAGGYSQNPNSEAFSGTINGVYSEGTKYTWECVSKYDFVKENCSEIDTGDVKNGVCGNTADGCASGKWSNLTDSTTEYKWECKGINGGRDSGTCTSPKPYCGNGTKDSGETCDNCPGDMPAGLCNLCGNGVKDAGEECDPNDSSHAGWGGLGCSSICEKLESGDCAATTTGYNGCSFSIPALSNGASTTTGTTTSGKIGSITATCNNGTLSYSGRSCYDAGGYQCTKEPDNAILVTGTNLGLTKNTESKLIAWNDTPASSDKCVYKCDHSNNYYYYPAGNRCEALSDICSRSEPNKCTVSWATVTNTGVNNGIYTWDCEADGKKVGSTCTFGGSSKCKYGGDKPACDDGSTPTNVKAKGYGFEWKCGSNSCSMEYHCPEPTIDYVLSSMEVLSPGWPYSSYCKNNYPDVWNSSSSFGNMNFSTLYECREKVAGLGFYITSINGSTIGNRCNYKVNGSQTAGCAPCFECGSRITGTSNGWCEIEGKSASSGCEGLENMCVKPSEPYCKKDIYNMVNTNQQYGCTAYSNLPTDKSLQDATELMKNYKWVRTQGFGPNIGGTTHDMWKKGDECEPYSIYCVPCVAPQCDDNFPPNDAPDTPFYSPECTNAPDNAIQVNGIGDSAIDVESKLIAYNASSSDKCVYKCDHSNNYYYYPAGKRCEALSDICSTSEPNKCTVSWATVENKKEENGKYTWDCKADGKKVGKTCEIVKTPDKVNGKCDYSKGGCSAGTKSEDSYQPAGGSPVQKSWICKGDGGGTSDTCIIKWDHEGKCSPANNGHCDGMFTNYASFGTGQCKSASAFHQLILYPNANSHSTAWPCAMNDAISGVSACSEYGRDYIPGALSVTNGFYRCFDWKETIKCKVHVSGNWEEKADSYCSGLTKPSNGTSLASDEIYDSWTNNYASTKSCSAGSNARSCSKVYEGTTPITNSFVGSGSDTTGVSDYCRTKSSESSCLGVKVINFKPSVQADLYIAPGGIVDAAWKTNNAGKRSELSCCKWS